MEVSSLRTQSLAIVLGLGIAATVAGCGSNESKSEVAAPSTSSSIEAARPADTNEYCKNLDSVASASEAVKAARAANKPYQAELNSYSSAMSKVPDSAPTSVKGYWQDMALLVKVLATEDTKNTSAQAALDRTKNNTGAALQEVATDCSQALADRLRTRLGNS